MDTGVFSHGLGNPYMIIYTYTDTHTHIIDTHT